MKKNPSEIIAGKKFTELIEQLKKEYDIIIFDSAPIMQATDSIVLGSKVDTCLITYFQGKISRNTLRRAKNQIEMVKSNVSGVIINGLKANLSADYIDMKYQYEYLYSYGSQESVPVVTAFSKIKQFFIESSDVVVGNIFTRLKKIRIIGLISIISLLIFGIIFLISNWDTLFSQPQMTSSEIKTIETPTVNEQKINHVSTDKDVSSQLKHYRDKLDIQRKEPEPQNNMTVSVLDVESSDMALQIPTGLSTPYTIQIQRTNDLELAKKQVKAIRKKGLDAFVTISFDNPSEKTYLICHGNFATKLSAEKTMIKLAVLGINGDFSPLYIPFSIYLGSETKYKNDIFSYPKYFESISQQSFLAGGFKSKEIANLFRKSIKAYRTKKILRR